MGNILKKLEKKIIVKNTLFIKKGIPRIPENKVDLNYSFSGGSSLEDMARDSNKIFAGFSSSTTVLIKINLNSANTYPASTSNIMLERLLKMLASLGVKDICIGDCSGLIHLPTRKVFKAKGFNFLKKYGAKFRVFDYGPWTRIPVKGEYFKEIIFSKTIYGYDKIINLSNFKSHNSAGFSFATKSLVGFMHPSQRYHLHHSNIKQKIAELALAIQPDINIIDARKIFVSGGPDTGQVAEANTIIVNSRLLEADLAAYNLLYSHQKKSGITGMGRNPYDDIFFKHFLKLQDKAL